MTEQQPAGESETPIVGDTRPVLGRTVKKDRPGVSGLLIVGLVAAAFVVVAAIGWVRAQRNIETGKATVAAIQTPTNEALDPSSSPSVAYQELVVAENASQVEAARSQPGGVVVPPLVGGTTTAEPSLDEPAPAQPTGYQSPYANVVAHDSRGDSVRAEGSRQATDYVRMKSAALQALSSRWGDMEAHSRVEGVSEVAYPQSAGGVQASQAEAGAPPISLPLVSVLPSVVEVGANTDYPGKVVVKLTGPYSGVKLIGDVQGSTNGPTDRLVLRFSEMFFNGVVYSIEGFAVDSRTSIPAIKGDTNRHVLYNVVTQSAAAFLAGYGSGLSQQRLTVGTDGNDVFLGGISSSALLRQQGATVASDQLGNMQYRRTTVTLPAGRLVGVVLTEQARAKSAQAAPVAAPAAEVGDFGGLTAPATNNNGY